MVEILNNLQPRVEMKDNIYLKKNEDVNEILFIQTGIIIIGFEFKNKVKYCVRLQNRGIVGANQVCFHRKTLFYYKIQKDVSGFTIYKPIWLNILNKPEYKVIAQTVLKRI